MVKRKSVSLLFCHTMYLNNEVVFDSKYSSVLLKGFH